MAHMSKIKVSAVGALETEAFDENYRSRQERVDENLTATNLWVTFNAEKGRAEATEPPRKPVSEAVKQAVATHEQTTGRKPRKDAVGVVCEVVTLPEELKTADRKTQNLFWTVTTRFLHDRYGDNFVGGVLHRDETTPHMHAYVTPLVEGKLNAKKMFDRRELQTFHQDFQAYIDKYTPGLCKVVSDEKDLVERRKSRQGKLSLEELKTKTVEAESELSATKQELQKAQEELEKTRSELKTTREEKATLYGQLGTAKTELHEAKTQLEQAQQEKEAAENVISDISEAAVHSWNDVRNGLKQMNVSPGEYGFPKKAADLREEARQQCRDVKSDMMRYLVTQLVTAVAYGIEKAVKTKKPQVMEVIQQSTKRMERTGCDLSSIRWGSSNRQMEL